MSNLHYLSEYSTFGTVDQLNESINDHVRNNQYELNETDRSIFLMLGRYAVKYRGVAHLKTATIAKAIDKSKRTVQRSIRKLERLSMIGRRKFIRKKSGGNGANLYVVLSSNVMAEVSPREEADKSTYASDRVADQSNETINLLSDSNTILETPTGGKPSSDTVIKRGLRHAIPSAIYEALEPFLDGQAMYDTYGVLLRAKASIDRRIALETHGERYIDAFYAVIRLHKAGKVRSLNGLLYVAWERLSAEISRQTSRQSNDSLFAYNPYSDSVEAANTTVCRHKGLWLTLHEVPNNTR